MVRIKARVREADLGLAALFGNFENDFCSVPFAFVFNKIELALENEPNNFLAWDEFRYLLLTEVVRIVTIGELIAEFVRTAFDSRLACPPRANIIDGSECF